MLTKHIAIVLASIAALSVTTAHGQAHHAQPIAIGNAVPGLSSLSMPVKSMRDMRYTNLVRQGEDFTCGAAALATILQNVFGRNISEREIINDMLANTDINIVRERGFSLLDMKKYAERIGLRAHGYKIDSNGLATIKIPVIALQTNKGYAHFVVVKRVHAGIVYIADPALGHRQMLLDEFVATWNGIVLAVVGNGLQPENALRDSAHSIGAAQRAGIVTRSLPTQQEFGLLGMDSF